MAGASTAVIVGIFAASGAGLGFAARSRMRQRRPRISWLVVLFAGLALRGTVEAVALPPAVPVLLASYAFLLAFCVKNIAWPAMSVVTLGLLLGLAPVLANQGMPVGAKALASAGLVDERTGAPERLLGGRHVESSDDSLLPLAEILPLEVASRTLSFGELIALVGMADVMFHAVARRPARRQNKSKVPGSKDDDTASEMKRRLAGLTIEDTGEFVRVLGPAELSPEVYVPSPEPDYVRPGSRRPAAANDGEREADGDREQVTAVARVSIGARRERLRAIPAG